MDAKKSIIMLDPEKEIIHEQHDINEALLIAHNEIMKRANGHEVKINMDTHDEFSGVFNRKVVYQVTEFKVTIRREVK